MIRPEEVKLTSDKRNALLAAIEEQFDEAIRKAEASGEWPAIVRHRQDGANYYDVSVVIAKYIDAGWKFDQFGYGRGRDNRAVILRPVTSSAEPA